MVFLLYRLGLSRTHNTGLDLKAPSAYLRQQAVGWWINTTIPGLSLAFRNDVVILNQCFISSHSEKHYFELLKCTVLVKASINILQKKGLVMAVATESHHGEGQWK